MGGVSPNPPALLSPHTPIFPAGSGGGTGGSRAPPLLPGSDPGRRGSEHCLLPSDPTGASGRSQALLVHPHAPGRAGQGRRGSQNDGAGPERVPFPRLWTMGSWAHPVPVPVSGARSGGSGRPQHPPPRERWGSQRPHVSSPPPVSEGRSAGSPQGSEPGGRRRRSQPEGGRQAAAARPPHPRRGGPAESRAAVPAVPA